MLTFLRQPAPHFRSDASRNIKRFYQSRGPPVSTWREELEFQPVLSFQPLRKRTAFDARPRRSTRASVASELCHRLVIVPARATVPMLDSTSSVTELLLRSQHRTSSAPNLRKSRITIKVPHPAMAWLMMNFSFDNINASKSAFRDGFPIVTSNSMRRLNALLGFVLRKSNKMVIRQPGDDYHEQDKI
ncbi:hypothetical protein MRX96_045210 [Rhipicephalus microplus]